MTVISKYSEKLKLGTEGLIFWPTYLYLIMTFNNMFLVKTSSGLQVFCNIFLPQQNYFGFHLHLLIIYFSQAVSVKFQTRERNDGAEQLANKTKALFPSGSMTGHRKAAQLLLPPRQSFQNNSMWQPCSELTAVHRGVPSWEAETASCHFLEKKEYYREMYPGKCFSFPKTGKMNAVRKVLWFLLLLLSLLLFLIPQPFNQSALSQQDH